LSGIVGAKELFELLLRPQPQGHAHPGRCRPERFLRRHVLTSRNVRGGWLTDVALNYQIEHHLFPSISRPNLRRSQPLIEAFCQQRGVPYCQSRLAGSYAQALRHLNAADRPACPGTAIAPAAREAAASLPVVSGLSATGPVPPRPSRRPDLR